MNFVIGDIHGEISKLESLISNILSFNKKPEFVFVGDYIDKGENSYLVLEYLTRLSIQYKCVFLIGNHEYYWINLDENTSDIKNKLLKYGANQTIESFGKNLSIYQVQNKIMSNYSSFFDSLVPYFIYGDFIVAHSGIAPEHYNSPIENIPVKAFLFNRYSFLKKEGYYRNKKIIFGHTGFYSPFYDGYKIGIDTACCYGENQPLSSFCMEENCFIDSSNTIYSVQDLTLSSCPVILRNIPWRIKK